MWKVGLKLVGLAFVGLSLLLNATLVSIVRDMEKEKTILVAKLESATTSTTEQKAPCKLHEWVYSASTKISRTQSVEVVAEIKKYKNPLLLLSLIQAESEFSPTAISSAGAIGFGQVMWKHWGKALVTAGICKESRDLFDYRVNIKATSFILQELLKQSNGDVAKALDRYLGAGNKAYKNKIVWNYMNLSTLNGGVTL